MEKPQKLKKQTTAKEEAGKLLPGVPVSIYGHSMGGNIVFNYLLKRNQSVFKCAIIESPWLALYKEKSKIEVIIAKILGFISPKIAIHSRLNQDLITGIVDKSAEYRNDPFYHNRTSLRLFAGVKAGCAYAMKNASKLTLPVYLALGKYDQIVSNKAIYEFIDHCGKNVQAKEYEAYHAIRKGSAVDEFFHDIIGYLNEYSIN